MRILVRAPNWLGDAVLCLPALRGLRNCFPSARIAILARPWVVGLFKREDCADEVFCYPPGNGAGAWCRKWRLAATLRRRYDWAILLPNSWESALVPWLARIPRRTGYARSGRGLLLTEPIEPPARGSIPAHEAHYYLELLRRAGVTGELPPALPILLSAIEQARSRGRQLFEAMGVGAPVVGISPGAQNSRAKQW
ncbi:MAG: glycosyltransferase family 9 protein, partial [Bryobacteraceae bacterium]